MIDFARQLVVILALLIPACFSLANPNDNNQDWPTPQPLRVFYIDSIAGNDDNSGLAPSAAWRSLERASRAIYKAGDHIYLKRDSEFTGCLRVYGDGTAQEPIVIAAYGQGANPRLSNPNREHHNGNALQIRGDHHIIQDLAFHHTAPAAPEADFEDIWKVGALHASLGSDYAIIRGNHFEANAKAIQSYSEHAIITHNSIRGRNDQQQDGFLSKPYWGPLGIQIGIGNQTIAYNVIENMFVQGGEWGADGGAIEIDDGRNHKDNIHIHHNTTRQNMGFLEISWQDEITQRQTRNIIIEHNISRDYQDFVLWWAENSNSTIRYNTIIRTEQIKGMFTDTVFLLEGSGIDINNNIIAISDDSWDAVYEGSQAQHAVHWQNLYWNIDDGDIFLAVAAAANEFTGNPRFMDFIKGDYRLKPESPAFGLGAFATAAQTFNPKAAGLSRYFAD